MIAFLIILAFFVLIFSVRVKVTINLDDELTLYVRAFGIKINILPKKPKKYRISDYTLKKIAKRDKKNAEAAAKKAQKATEKKAKKTAQKQKKKEEAAKLTKEEKRAQKQAKKAARPPMPDTVSLFLRIIKLFFSGFLSRFHFHVARINIIVGADDAAKTALTYYVISNAIRPVLNFLDKHSNLHGMKNAEINVAPDFLSEEIKAEVNMSFSMSLGGLLGVLFKTAFSFAFGWFKIKPSSTQTSSDGHKIPKSSCAKNSADNKTENK